MDAQDDQTVSIPDTGLAGAIRTQLGLGADTDITSATMLKLTELVAGGWNISNLNGLEHATNLQTLQLMINQISDLQPLAQLTNLQKLYLSDNQISNIQPLAQLTNLQTLELANNQITDVTPLAQLVNLKKLFLAGNPLGDTSPLANLNLTSVDIKIKKAAAEPTQNTDAPAQNTGDPTLLSDLVVPGIRVSKTTLAPGEQFTVFATVKNRGGNRSDSGTLNFLYSTTNTVNPSDATVGIGGARLDPLDPNRQTELSRSVTAPRQAGTYYYSACAVFCPRRGRFE